MKICSYCNDVFGSPIDAKHCINCGALFQANTGATYRLDNNPAHDKHVLPDIGKIEYGSVEAKRYPYLEDLKQVFFMRKEDILQLIAMEDGRITWVHWDDIEYPYEHGTTYFYNHKKIVFVK